MNRATAGLVLAGLAALAGCERSEPTSTSPPSRTTPTTPSTSPDTAPRTDAQKEARDRQLSSWRKQLDDSKTRIDALRTRAANAPDSVKMELTGAVHDLDDQTDKIQSRINGCKDASSTNWDGCKTDIDAMFAELNLAVRQVTDKFANPPAPTPPSTPPDGTPPTPPSTPPTNPPSTPPSNPPDNPGPGPG
jgi:hypothetical protein